MKTNHSTQDYTQWSLPKGAKARLGKGHITGHITYSPDGTRLVVPSSIGIWIYDAHSFEEVGLITEHRGFNPSAIGFSPGGNLIASGCQNTLDDLHFQKLQIWDEDAKQSKDIFIDLTEQIVSLALSSDGWMLASGNSVGTICLWSVASGKQVYSWDKVYTEPVFSLAFSPDSRTLASGSEDGTVLLWDLDTYAQMRTVPGRNWGLVFCPIDRPLVASIVPSRPHDPVHAHERGIDLWNARTDIRTYIRSADCFTSNLAFSPDGRMLACADVFVPDDICAIRVWDVASGNQVHSWGSIDPVFSLAFSPDGRTLAGGSEDGTVLLWDLDTSSVSVSTAPSVPIPNAVTGRDGALPEEKAELSNRASQIQRICKERGITTLCHFTRIENLHSILRQGLLGRSVLEGRGQQFLSNDDKRIDECPEANCLSISFPNYRMFYKIRMAEKENKGISDSQWVVLVLDAKILWELECIFCKENAASNAIREVDLEDRKKPEALKGMFEDFYNIRHQDLSIPQDYPTHPQAEVLVFDPIPVRYIKAIHFWDAAAQEKWLPNSTGANYETSCTNRHYFQSRRDYEVWRSANFDNEGIPYTPENNVDVLDDSGCEREV